MDKLPMRTTRTVIITQDTEAQLHGSVVERVYRRRTSIQVQNCSKHDHNDEINLPTNGSILY